LAPVPEPAIGGIALGATVLALLGQILGCRLGVWGPSRRSIAIVGIGLAPWGQAGYILAGLGLALGAIPRSIISIVVIMSILTPLVVPPAPRVLCAGDPATAVSAEDRATPTGRLPGQCATRA
jgi:Kef-type K+ transport system membrane component KefB